MAPSGDKYLVNSLYSLILDGINPKELTTITLHNLVQDTLSEGNLIND